MLPGSREETTSLVPRGLVCHRFPISEIQFATQDFNDRLLIGKGGFGKVYKGKMKIGTKTAVAIKRLDPTSAQGATEFWAEVEMLSMLRHCNLVSLIGYCNDNGEMILIYEYMPNGTLEDHLHKLHTPLSFSQRLKICIGAARGLQYLHTGTGTEQGIIHRDVKSSNILLDNNWAAKISDFGLSKIGPTDKPSTYVNTLIKGTFGYFDPEYFSTGKLTRKSDVFSFGVILLEVLCRKRAVDRSLDEEQWGLVGWAQDFLRGGKLKEIVDPFLKGQISFKCLNDYAKLVDGCLHTRLKLRITMTEVVFGLESILALHKRSDNSFSETGIITFGRKLQKYLFSSEETYGNGNKNTTGTRNPWRSNPPTNVVQELVRVGWPSWLATIEVSQNTLPGSREETTSLIPRGLVCHHIPISEIQLATQDFNDRLLIGKGGFGKVYKGKMKTGTKTVVAIKRLDPASAQGATEFWAEVEMLSMLRHCNLVSLIGYCYDNGEMILIYEYMPNGTLEDHLHKLHTPLSFSQRLKICIGAARGLQYLHTGTGTEQGIIHRDVKSSNILLDNNWAAKISDFGLSKIGPTDKPSTYVNTLIKGTFGYFDPEYFSTGKLTRKSDVFSFGVILLEVLCRKRAVDRSLDEEQWGLVGWAQDFLRGGKLKEIVDPFLKGQISFKCLNDYAKLVDGCLHTRLKLRITMAEVLFGLESILALHEWSDNSFSETGIIKFGRKLQKYLFSSEETYGNGNNNTTGTRNPWGGNPPTNVVQELVRVGWPSWLAAVSGEALKGWLPRRAHTFKKLGKIAEGSCSVVYKAKDTLTGNVVALKKIKCDTSDLESVKMMAMEIVILRRLDHPNVIKLEGIVASPMSETLYLVFEYMDHDLAALSTDNAARFTEPQVKHYMHQLFSGLKYCHDNQVLHRDLKGSDLLVNNNGVLKIADFGSASFFGLIPEQPMTNFVATYWYRAPELLLGATEYGAGVDLWSAGCIMAGLLAKRPILAGQTETEQLQKIYALCGSPPDEYWKTYQSLLKTPYKPPFQYRRCLTETLKDFPPSLLSLLDVLLSIDPAKRQSAAFALKSKFLGEMS